MPFFCDGKDLGIDPSNFRRKTRVKLCPPHFCAAKVAFAPDLPFLQHFTALRQRSCGQISLTRGHEIAVLQLSGAALVRRAQTIGPERTALAVLLIPQIESGQSAGAAAGQKSGYSVHPVPGGSVGSHKRRPL